MTMIQVKRFNDHNYDPIPGPGQYSARLRVAWPELMTLAKERPTNQTTNDAPGPGEYEQAANAFEAHEQKGSRSVFASRTNRGFIPRVEGPAPGQYENLLALERGIAKSQRQTQSIFKSTVRRVETPKAAVPGTSTIQRGLTLTRKALERMASKLLSETSATTRLRRHRRVACL
ncbi:unnamed protein product [Aphanomyces euteiches]